MEKSRPEASDVVHALHAMPAVPAVHAMHALYGASGCKYKSSDCNEHP